MCDELVGYLLGALEVEEIVRIEQVIAADGRARLQLEVLRIALLPLECACRQADAPDGLAVRTCQKIRELCR